RGNQVGLHDCGRRKACAAFLSQAALQDLVKSPNRCRIARQMIRALQNVGQQLVMRGTVEWTSTSNRFDGHHTDGEQITAFVNRASGKLLWRHISEGSQHGAGSRNRSDRTGTLDVCGNGFRELSQAEIQNIHSRLSALSPDQENVL